MGAYWPQHNRWKYFILCVPLLTPRHLFSCTVCSHTKPKNSSFTLIFGICLTLSCSVEEDFLILLKRIAQQEKPSKVLPYTVTNMNELGSVRDAGLYSHPWSHTVFNGKLHVISAPAGSVVGEQRGTLRTNEGTCEGTSVQLLTNHHHGPSGMAAASLENEPFELSGTQNTHKDGWENEMLNHCPSFCINPSIQVTSKLAQRQLHMDSFGHGFTLGANVHKKVKKATSRLGIWSEQNF